IIYWQLIDGTDTLDWVTENGGGNSYNFTAPGEYSLCAEYFSADCPEGVTICEVLVVPDCNEPCQLEIVANDLGGGLFEFTAYGWPQDEELTWYPGDGTVLDGPWEMQNFYGPGNYEICAVMTNDSCSSVEDCVFIEVGEIECQWFEFAISSIIPDVPASFDWVIEDGDGNEAGSGSVELSGDTVTVLGEACVAAGCYTLTLNSDYPIGLESFDLDFPELPGNLIDINWIQGTNPFEMQAEISIGTECDWTIGVEESLLESVKIFPVPTDGELHIQLPADQLVELRFFNSVGKLVLTETVQYQKTISLRHLPAGTYVLQLQHDEKIKTFSIPLLN